MYCGIDFYIIFVVYKKGNQTLKTEIMTQISFSDLTVGQVVTNFENTIKLQVVSTDGWQVEVKDIESGDTRTKDGDCLGYLIEEPKVKATEKEELTDLEKRILNLIESGDDYEGGNAECIRNLEDYSGFNARILRGVLSSLIKKAKIVTAEFPNGMTAFIKPW